MNRGIVQKIELKLIDWYPRIFGRRIFLKLNNFLLHLGLRGIGILNYKGIDSNGERKFIDFLRSNYSLTTILDVGANKGEFTAMLSDIDAKIFCFEPHPLTFKIR